MGIYTPSVLPQFENRQNCWSRLRIEVPAEELGDICTVRKVALAVYSVVSSCTAPPVPAPLLDFWSVIESWGNTWLWDNLTIRGDVSWLADSIADNSLTAVTDDSYTKDTYPHLNSAAFVFECTKGRGWLWGSFVEHSPGAGSNRGELLGLVAIHLILKVINEVNTYLRGSVHILSDCLSALKKIEDLPPYRIPTHCSHSDILKNIKANCSGLSFKRIFSHVKAHQDDNKKYSDLSRDAQLN